MHTPSCWTNAHWKSKMFIFIRRSISKKHFTIVSRIWIYVVYFENLLDCTYMYTVHVIVLKTYEQGFFLNNMMVSISRWKPEACKASKIVYFLPQDVVLRLAHRSGQYSKEVVNKMKTALASDQVWLKLLLFEVSNWMRKLLRFVK